jgi:glutamate 5-kinase
LQTAGKVILDAGAVRKLTADGKSLLPIGVVEIAGEFGRGDVISCVDETGRLIARGISNYASSDARRIMRRPSSEIGAILGFVEEPELVHRDNMVLL